MFEELFKILCCGILKEEPSLEVAIATAGLERPGGEVVAEDLGQVEGVDFKHRLFGVYCLLLRFSSLFENTRGTTGDTGRKTKTTPHTCGKSLKSCNQEEYFEG